MTNEAGRLRTGQPGGRIAPLPLLGRGGSPVWLTLFGGLALLVGAQAHGAPTPVPPVASSKIAFASDRDGDFEVYDMDASGAAVARLTNSSHFDGQPAWSFDGRRIAFSSNREGTSQIFVMNAEGSGQTKLTDGRRSKLNPAWSPDGQRIAYRRNLPGGNSEIFAVGTNGEDQARLTNTPAVESQPAWSPDRRSIAFTSDRDGNFEIYVMNADGSGQRRLTSTRFTESKPAWSPDGTKIAFASNRDDNFEIYVMNADGSGQVRLTNSPRSDLTPTWSPDGRAIAFRSNRNGDQGEIYVMNADGSGQTRLTNNPARDIQPSWTTGPLPPTLVLSGRRHQRLKRGRFSVYARCTQACRAKPRGRVRVSGRKKIFRLPKRPGANLSPGVRRKLRFRLSRRQLHAVRLAFSSRRPVVVTVSARASNDAAVYSRRATRRIVLKR